METCLLKVKETLKKILNEREGLSVSALARMASVPKANILTWMEGASPNVEQLDRVAKALGVSFEYLAFGRSDEEKEEAIFDKILMHSGTYEISVKKIVKKNE
jgi:transcriptional regulator with XRE-family HTH domain